MALSLKETKVILGQLGVIPKRKLGQNFLVDSQVVERSIEWAEITPGEVFIEVGPGCGTLTDSLLKAGAQVFAIERDQIFAKFIEQRFSINVLQGDAIEHPAGSFDLSKPYKVAANLPYAIASVWVNKLLELSHLPDLMVLLLQKEAADRWFAEAGSKQFSAISIVLQAAYCLSQKYPVHKRCFYPQPKVDSVLLQLRKREDSFIFSKKFKQFLRNVFMHRRQQIGRIFRSNRCEQVIATVCLQYLHQRHLSETLRAEVIPLDFWLEMAQACF